MLELLDGWDPLVAKYRDGPDWSDVLRKRPATWGSMARVIRLMVATKGADLHRSFPSLMKALIQLRTITRRLGLGRTLLKLVVGSRTADLVPVPFMLLNSTLAPRFLSVKQAIP
jgi:hypothetical protein